MALINALQTLHHHQLPSIVLGLIAFTATVLLRHARRLQRSKLNVPVVGGSTLIESWLTSFKWKNGARKIIEEGYRKVLTPIHGWEVWLCDQTMLSEYKNMTDNCMTPYQVTEQLFQTKLTFPAIEPGGVPMNAIARSVTWIRTRASQGLDPYFAQFVTSFRSEFDDAVTETTNQEWKVLSSYELSSRILSRLTAMTCFGSTVSERPNLVRLVHEYVREVPRTAAILSKYPKILRRLVSRFCAAPALGRRFLTAVIDEVDKRRTKPSEQPLDIIDWLLEYAENSKMPISDVQVGQAIVAFHFAAMNTTILVMMCCLHEIATRGHYVAPLRSEIDEVLKRNGGWHKSTVEDMSKLDSFIKECQRFYPIDAAAVSRHALRDFDFSNGLHVPQGAMICTASAPLLFDDENYPGAQEFDGFRHHKLAKTSGPTTDHKFVSIGPKNLQFGDGRHLCPGRWMAADSIRLTLAYLLANYDISMENGNSTPSYKADGKWLRPDLRSEVKLRKRKNPAKFARVAVDD